MNDCLCYNFILCNDLTCILRDKPRRIRGPPIDVLLIGFDVSSFPICAKKNKTNIRL